ncbi:hypothetical protein ACM66B_003814 [Microbotryomycetes sp. NB124-2]
MAAAVLPPRAAVNDNSNERRVLVTCFWLVIVAFGVPYWWATTTIERLPLPVSRIRQWKQAEPCYVTTTVNLDVRSDDHTVDSSLTARAASALGQLDEVAARNCVKIERRHAGMSHQLSALASLNDIPAMTSEYTLLVSPKYNQTSFTGRTALVPSRFDQDPQSLVTSAATLLDLDSPSLDHRVVNYAPTYKVVFSLLNEDSAAGSAVYDWPIEELLRRHITPLLRRLSSLHRFQIETSIQHFSPLAVPVLPGGEGTMIQEDDLRAFVNNADWNLPASITLDPVLHFMLFVPSARHRPMRFNSTGGVNAFITPQRGGVVLMNPPVSGSLSGNAHELEFQDFSPSFALFRQQLRKILGVPSSTLAGHGSSNVVPDQWQIDAMVRARTREAVKESVDTLTSIVKLVQDIPNMRVGRQVQSKVERAVDELDKVDRQLELGDHDGALRHASNAATLSSQAYFDPSMLALLYFPDEHKYAIYTPLFGPVAVPLVVVLVKEFKDWKERRKRRRAHAKSEEKNARTKQE